MVWEGGKAVGFRGGGNIFRGRDLYPGLHVFLGIYFKNNRRSHEISKSSIASSVGIFKSPSHGTFKAVFLAFGVQSERCQDTTSDIPVL